MNWYKKTDAADTSKLVKKTDYENKSVILKIK